MRSRRTASPVPPASPARRGGPVLEILESDAPIDALRRYLAGVGESPTPLDSQVVVRTATLLLESFGRERRGSDEVRQLVDLVLSRWTSLPDRDGFHGTELLSTALSMLGDDPPRLARLVAALPESPTGEVLLELAAAHARVDDRRRMLDAVRRALEAGLLPSEVRSHPDLAARLARPDRDLDALLEFATHPRVPVDVERHVPEVRSALRRLVRTLEGLGVRPRLPAPASLDHVLETERLVGIELPNDARALLTLTDGAELWEKKFLGCDDYRRGPARIGDRVAIANWGQPDDWLLYDPDGRTRGGEPGYVLVIDAAESIEHDLVGVLDLIVATASDVLGTN